MAAGQRKNILMQGRPGKKAVRYGAAAAVLAGVYGILRLAACRSREPEDINGDTPCLDASERDSRKAGLYENLVKPAADHVLAFGALVLLAPVYGAVGLAVFLDDPGPIFFTQKRIGRSGNYFLLHKFRTMKMSAPHNVPTHCLKDPERYITGVGKVLRRTSLDELPQFWDIFRGKMSVIGPRPALWNQTDLAALRKENGAWNLLPGLTGLAQISGRDELEIEEKARLDGEYAAALHRGGLRAFGMDVKCFLGTVCSVAGSEGIVEGGTGSLYQKESHKSCSWDGSILEPVKPEDVGFEEYGCRKQFHIKTGPENHKRVLITGAGSYIGESFRKYAEEKYGENFTIDTLDMKESSWREADFRSYDTVLHVAGIAHVDVSAHKNGGQSQGNGNQSHKNTGNITINGAGAHKNIDSADESLAAKYYEVNTKLAVETARKAKNEGVGQFIFMSSLIVYGDSAPYGGQKMIDENTLPCPSNFYGDSKWQADRGVRAMKSEDFHVAVLRPPMVYGRGSKGNYPVLAGFARRLPVFPDVSNQRSMLYIDNLSQFLCLLALSGEGGVYFPQNAEYTATGEMVRMISTAAGKRIWVTGLFNPVAALASHIPGRVSGLADKAFGSMVISQSLSKYAGMEYRVKDLESSVRETESSDLVNLQGHTDGKRVLILANHDLVVYNFRLELVERLLEEGFEVHISCPRGERTGELTVLGALHHHIDLDRHGMNPLAELHLLGEYNRLLREVRPCVVMTFTIKPNIYGGIAARHNHVPFLANITGLGTSLENGGLKQRGILALYKQGLRGAEMVFFQNRANLEFMVGQGVVPGPKYLLPGSGVNLDRNSPLPYPREEKITFAVIGRLMKDKGTDELLEAAARIRREYPETRFLLAGFFDGDYREKVERAAAEGNVVYLGEQKDIRPCLRKCHAVVQPSYHEGMSNVLLEAAAASRPVIASRIPGCRETFDEGVSGIGFEPRSTESLTQALRQFLHMSQASRIRMGEAGRAKMERAFDRKIVVDRYMEEINRILEEKENVRRPL